MHTAQLLARAGDADDTHLLNMIKDTGVLTSELRDFAKWDWWLVSDLLAEHAVFARKRMDNATVSRFLRRLLAFFTPSSSLYHTLLQQSESDIYSTCACALMRLLLAHEEGQKLIGQSAIFVEISTLFSYVQAESGPLSVTAVGGHAVQTYFDMIGVLCESQQGQQLLADARIFSRLYVMCDAQDRDDLIQLIIKRIPWTAEGMV